MTNQARDKIIKELKAERKIMRSAVGAAIQKAEIYKTSLVIKEDGKIKELTPRQMKARLAKA